MSEYKTNQQINLSWGQTFRMNVKSPAIANRVFKTYADALEFANDFKNTAVAGLILTVILDTDSSLNGAYFLAKAATGIGKNDAVLEKIGTGGGSTTATTYTDAQTIATANNIGQIVYVTENTYAYNPTSATSSGETYYVADGSGYTQATSEQISDSGVTKYTVTTTATDGAYIVTGVNSISKLSESTPSGDVTQDVISLQKDVETIKEKLYFECADEEDLGLTE